MENENTIMYNETKVGAGYYALRKTKSKSGRTYTKLVKADRSPLLKVRVSGLEPSVGHNERRQRILNKRELKNKFKKEA